MSLQEWRDGVASGDIVEVSKGYVRNFLEPRGLAIAATAGAEAQATAMRRARDIKDARDRESAEEVAKVLVARTIQVSARAGGGGRLFGSVTGHEIADAVLEQTGIELDRIGQSDMIGSILALSMCREMGPFMTAIILAATVGSAMAATFTAALLPERGACRRRDPPPALFSFLTNRFA